MTLQERITNLSATKLALLEKKLRKKRASARPAASKNTGRTWLRAPLSFSQERLWFLEQMDPDSCAYNLPDLIPMPGPVDSSLVRECLHALVERHSALRTRFVLVDENPQQMISEDSEAALDYSEIDLRGHTGSEATKEALNREVWRPFDLATGPLLRARLFLRDHQENFLLVVMHHIVSDGWSLDILSRELRALYEARATGRSAGLAELPLHYVDHAMRQRKLLEGPRLESLLAYWRNQLDGAPLQLQLPLDHPRPARQSLEGALHSFAVDGESLKGLDELCRACGVVPFMVLLSAFKVLLFRYTHQRKIVVGTPIANRNRSEVEGVIGFFTNTLVLCNSIAPDMSFRELLARVRETTLGAYEHQELPFEKLVSELQPQRSLSHNPLFQVMFTFQNLPKADKADGQEPEALPGPSGGADGAGGLEVKVSKFDLTLAMTETGSGLSAVFEYATQLFEKSTIERMEGHFVRILEHLLRHPDEPLGAFCFLSPDERRRVLYEWNDTERVWEETLPLHGRFVNQARLSPDAPALRFRDQVLTYREVDHKTDRIAAALLDRGVERGDIVGICLYRSLEMVLGLYGISKAGAAYMPIEPGLPAERAACMLSDAEVAWVVTTSDCLDQLTGHGVSALSLDEHGVEGWEEGGEEITLPEMDIRPGDLAYVLFTSGSTGQPKGVMVSHGAIANRLLWMQERYKLSPDDRVMQKTPFSFDVSVWEFFWPLAEGACLVVAEPERHKETAYLSNLIRQQEITCLHFVPSMLQLFLHEDLSELHSLKRIICSGEALTVEQCRRLQEIPGVSGHNLYGPTEAAVDVTHWDCEQWRDQYLSVPIGRPISNTQIYILSDGMQPTPIGVAGELYIGGQNLAEGYANKPELTRERFVSNPFVDDAGARLYRTGDLARFRSDGNIEYIGRVDTQVKLRGLRIELGEIEFHLREFPGVLEAVVIVHRFGENDERLVAYVVPEEAGGDLDGSAIGAALAQKLPSYMVPASFIPVADLPLTTSGKLDRKRLPEPTVSRTLKSLGPATAIENELLGFWRKFLKTDEVGVEDDFFEAGGHSILGTQMVNSISRHYRLNLPIRLLFEKPTVKALARALSELEDEAWLEESKTASSLRSSSDRYLLSVLDELTEEELNDLLEKRADAPELARFEGIESLLAWASEVLGAPRAPGSRAKTAEAASPRTPQPIRPQPQNGGGTESFGILHFRTCWDLLRIRRWLDGLEESTDEAILESTGHEKHVVASTLKNQGERLFQDYVGIFESRLFGRGHGDLDAAELWEMSGQMLNSSRIAAQIASPRSEAGGDRSEQEGGRQGHAVED